MRKYPLECGGEPHGRVRIHQGRKALCRTEKSLLEFIDGFSVELEELSVKLVVIGFGAVL